jgi:hypothetical protein
MDNKELKLIKEEKIKSFFKQIHKPRKLDAIMKESIDTKSQRKTGRKLSRTTRTLKQSATKKRK